MHDVRRRRLVFSITRVLTRKVIARLVSDLRYVGSLPAAHSVGLVLR